MNTSFSLAALASLLIWSELSVAAPTDLPKFILTQPNVCYSIDGLPEGISVASLKLVPEKKLRTKLNAVVGVNGALKFAGRTYPLSGSCVFVKYDNSWGGDQAMPFGGACHMQGALGLGTGGGLGAPVGLESVSMAMAIDYGTGPYKLALALSRTDETGSVQVKKYYPTISRLKSCSDF